jgi:hypothetical protein
MTKGFEGENFFKILFVLVFVFLKNVSQLIQSCYGTKLNYGDDGLYDYLKYVWVDCGKILTYFSRQSLKIIKRKGDSTDISCPKCLIIDDTFLRKTGKIIKQIGRVFDHCSRNYQLGMKVLVYGLWNEIKLETEDLKTRS